MKKYHCIWIFLFLARFLPAQIPNIVPAVPAVARTSVADTQSWTAFNNPAMLGYTESVSLSFSLENRYLIKELSTIHVQAQFPTKHLNISGSFSYFGYSLYHEMLFGLDFARNFADKFALGIGVNYYAAYFTAANEYHGTILFNLGLSARLTSKFTLGFSAFNPFQQNIRTEYVVKRLPSVFSLGTEYFFIPDLVWRAQIDKEISSNYRFATGFEYTMLDFLTVKLGAYVLDYFTPCLGAGFTVDRFYADLNCELNPLLGLTTAIILRYSFTK